MRVASLTTNGFVAWVVGRSFFFCCCEDFDGVVWNEMRFGWEGGIGGWDDCCLLYITCAGNCCVVAIDVCGEASRTCGKL